MTDNSVVRARIDERTKKKLARRSGRAQRLGHPAPRRAKTSYEFKA